MKKKINLAAEGFKIDGLPPEILNGVFPCVILDFTIEPYRFKKSEAQGFQTVYTVAISTADSVKVRTITLQHPFLSPKENTYILQTRGAKWRALHDSLRLNQEETESLCMFLDGTSGEIKYHPYKISAEERQCCKCDRQTGLSIRVNNKDYYVCRDHCPEYMVDIVDIHLHQMFLINKPSYCQIKDKDPKNGIQYPFSRFLNQKGYEYLLEANDDENKPTDKIEVDMNTASEPEDDFGGEQ